jgi:hypothetical protein
MKVIWKYPLSPGRTQLEMPSGAQVLCVQLQGRSPVMWALVDDAIEKEKRDFAVYGTGWDLPDKTEDLNYYGTFQVDGLVFHVFEIEE